jgi:DNA-binding response OmpR family regulator
MADTPIPLSLLHSLPGMSGLELLLWRNLKLEVPVNVITAYGDAETMRKVLESGAEALLYKPIGFAEVRGKIGTRLGLAA